MGSAGVSFSRIVRVGAGYTQWASSQFIPVLAISPSAGVECNSQSVLLLIIPLGLKLIMLDCPLHNCFSIEVSWTHVYSGLNGDQCGEGQLAVKRNGKILFEE